MKLTIKSDIHLEFMEDPLKSCHPGEGDILVLAGDVCTIADYDRFHEWFLEAARNYNRVLYVEGNHEKYGWSGDWREATMTLRRQLPDGITLLDNTSVLIDGVHFIGATMWTNFNNMNLQTMEEGRGRMNDYHQYNGWTPEDALEQHLISREWFGRCIPMLRGRVVAITHHAPSPRSVKGRYSDAVAHYSTNLESFITEHPNITHWIHGHIHHQNDYMVGQCRVIANPHGYWKVEPNSAYVPNFTVELDRLPTVAL